MNAAKRGGGIANNVFLPQKPIGGFARVFLTRQTGVAGNVATQKGGGVFNGKGADLHSRGARIAANHPDNCFGC
jgi:hypothetical protein